MNKIKAIAIAAALVFGGMAFASPASAAPYKRPVASRSIVPAVKNKCFMATMPNVINRYTADAVTLVNNAGLTNIRLYENKDGGGRLVGVIAQTPAAGSCVPYFTEVELYLDDIG